jgi:hypothetical protein
MDKPIEELGVSDECLRNIKSTGITKIGELVEAFERGADVMDGVSVKIRRHYEEMSVQLKAKGCWPDSLD